MTMLRVLAMCALAAAATGCVTAHTFETGRDNPSLEIVGGGVKYQGEYVMPQEVPELLEECGVAHDTVIHVRIHEFDRLKEAQLFRGMLARAGYTRVALVTKEHGESWSQTKARPDEPRTGSPSRPRVRMRKAYEE